MRALIVKETHQIVRDPSSILIAFVLPMILLFLFGYGVSLDAKRIKLGIVLEDGGPDGQSLVSSFVGSRYFEVHVGRNLRVYTDDVTAGRLRGMLVIPSDFSRKLAQPGGKADIQLLADGSETNTANYVQNYSRGVLQAWLRQRGMDKAHELDPPVSLVPRVWYNPELKSRNALVPGALAIIMAIIGTLLTALVVSREWERGTMEAMLATPVGVVELLLGKLIPYYVLGLGSMVVSTFVAVFVMGIPYRGSLPALLATAGAFLFTALGQGLLISTASRNQFIASQVALITGFLPAFLLSGFIFDIASMPLPIRILTRIIPARYLVTNLQTLFLVGDIWAVLLPNILILLVLASVLVGLTARSTAKRLE